MLMLKVLITRYVDEAQPGWVECGCRDAWGRDWVFVDKVPIFTVAALDKNSAYPQPGVIACEKIREWQDAAGRTIVTVDTETPWHIVTNTGETRFDVLPEQLTWEVA